MRLSLGRLLTIDKCVGAYLLFYISLLTLFKSFLFHLQKQQYFSSHPVRQTTLSDGQTPTKGEPHDLAMLET